MHICLVRFLSFMFSWTWIKTEYPGPSTVVRNTFKNKTKLLCEEWILPIYYERILIKMHHKNDGSLWLCPFTHLIERGCFLRPVSFERESPRSYKAEVMYNKSKRDSNQINIVLTATAGPTGHAMTDLCPSSSVKRILIRICPISGVKFTPPLPF